MREIDGARCPPSPSRSEWHVAVHRNRVAHGMDTRVDQNSRDQKSHVAPHALSPSAFAGAPLHAIKDYRWCYLSIPIEDGWIVKPIDVHHVGLVDGWFQGCLEPVVDDQHDDVASDIGFRYKRARVTVQTS